MDQRKKPLAMNVRRQLRDELYDAIERGELPLQEAVKRMRVISGLTQAEFAENRGVSIKVIKEIESGAGNPTVNTLNQIGKIFCFEVSFVRSERLVRDETVHRKGISGPTLEQLLAALDPEKHGGETF